MTDDIMLLPVNLFKYWWDLVHEAFLDHPEDHGLSNLYDSIIGFYNKHRGIKK